MKVLHEELKVENLEDLRRAAQAGSLRSLRGMSERTEQQILTGIEALETRQERMRLGQESP